jgi:hypothetical protein
MVHSRMFRAIAVIFPALGVVVGSPLATGPFAGDARGVFGPYFLMAVPVYCAVLAAPGYLTCLFEEHGARSSTAPRRWWIRASLALATLASAAGIWGAHLMILFGPPALVALGCVIWLWVRFERAGDRAPD